ncbi:MAG: SCO family protein [Planctomycetota bacterium]|mgnify:CR=1 FL=1|nr:MAG: SCO family protein [Planctomycetota bacterium]
MHSGAVRFWVLLIAALSVGYASLLLVRKTAPEPPAEPPRAEAPKPAEVAPSPAAASNAALPAGEVAPFELIDENGEPFDSRSLEGEVWVASFFFTNCPAVCWRMNQALAGWQATHPESDVRFVSITCDPENDTPEALARYAKHFKADPKRWTFLTGDMETIQSIGQDSFQIAVVRGDHTDRACVVDREGRVRGRFRLTEPDQVQMLDRLLTVAEAEPAREKKTEDGNEPSAESEAEPEADPPADSDEPVDSDESVEPAEESSDEPAAPAEQPAASDKTEPAAVDEPE